VIVCIPFTILDILLAGIDAENLVVIIIMTAILMIVSFLEVAVIASVLALAYTWLVEPGDHTGEA